MFIIFPTNDDSGMILPCLIVYPKKVNPLTAIYVFLWRTVNQNFSSIFNIWCTPLIWSDSVTCKSSISLRYVISFLSSINCLISFVKVLGAEANRKGRTLYCICPRGVENAVRCLQLGSNLSANSLYLGQIWKNVELFAKRGNMC